MTGGRRRGHPEDATSAGGAQHGRVTVNIQQAAARTQVSRRTIYNWLTAGKLQFVRTAGGSVRIFEDSLFRA